MSVAGRNLRDLRFLAYGAVVRPKYAIAAVVLASAMPAGRIEASPELPSSPSVEVPTTDSSVTVEPEESDDRLVVTKIDDHTIEIYEAD